MRLKRNEVTIVLTRFHFNTRSEFAPIDCQAYPITNTCLIEVIGNTNKQLGISCGMNETILLIGWMSPVQRLPLKRKIGPPKPQRQEVVLHRKFEKPLPSPQINKSAG